MAERGHTHLDLLKVDVESSEWNLFDELCRSDSPLPFDQVVVELHGPDAARTRQLVACLDAHGLYPFAREENLHALACTQNPTSGGRNARTRRRPHPTTSRRVAMRQFCILCVCLRI
jgi:hypothetical protein